MEKGDLVNFYTSHGAWQSQYRDRNPGLVIASREPTDDPYDKGHAYVLWANGDMSREHMTFLEKVRS